jgi:hypothetical protein
MKSAMKSSRKDEDMEPGLPELIDEADAVFSRYVRLSAANENGIIECYICDKPIRWQDADCMHYNHREDYFLRWDLRNCKAGCQTCNRHKRGNLIKFGKRLNKENPGITDIINEEARLVYKVSREEVRMIIFEYSQKVKALIKMIHNTS